MRLAGSSGRAFVLGALLLVSIFGVSARKAIAVQRDGYNRQFATCMAELREKLPPDGMILGDALFWLARPELRDYASKVLVETPFPGRDAAGWWQWINPQVVLWPGAISGAGAAYVLGNHFQLDETIPVCSRFMQIWLKPGVTLRTK